MKEENMLWMESVYMKYEEKKLKLSFLRTRYFKIKLPSIR